MTEDGRMLWLLLCLLPLTDCSTVTLNPTYKDGQGHEAVVVTRRPHIYFCRSPNMEDFSCWWHPLDNLTDGEEVAYILTYSVDKGPRLDCPDYMSAGPNSCHFSKRHTSVWKIYCMNVMAVTAHRNYTSQEHCLDVADIVQTEAPVNLTYVLTDTGGDEMGHNVQVSWKYPVPSHLQYGWITLVYELQYRRLAEPENWKMKQPLREPQVELLGLPVGDFVIRVRCRSQNYGMWSTWSSTLTVNIPTKVAAGKLLVLILVTGVGVVALLVIALGVLPQSRRIKEYFLPPIPKPRIMGIDPLLLKKGQFDEINRHFSDFHSYRPPSYTERSVEIWDQVSADSTYLTTPKDCSIQGNPTDGENTSIMVPYDQMPIAANHQLGTQNSTPYIQSLSPYCASPHEAFAPPLPTQWQRPEIMSLPGTDYSVMGNDKSFHAPDASAVPARLSPQDFYTCVQLMNECGEVHLVPCMQQPYCKDFPPLTSADSNAGEKEKLVEYQARKNLMKDLNDNSKTDSSVAAVPLLPVAFGNKS